MSLTIHNLLQRVQAAYRAIYLPPSVIAYDDAVTANLHALLGVLYVLNTLDCERLATADLLPRLDEPWHLLPAVCPAMPHVVNPLCAGLVRHRLRVDTILLQPLLEDWIRQTEVGANAVVEGVVGGVDVIVAPAELPCVHRENAGREARVDCPFQQRDGKLVVVWHVKLEKATSFSVRLAHILNARRASRAQAVWQVQLFRNLRYGQLAIRVVDFVDADGCKADWCADLVAPDLVLGVTLVGVDEHARDDLVAEEGLAIGEVSVGLAGIARSVEPTTFTQLLLGALFEFPGFWTTMQLALW